MPLNISHLPTKNSGDWECTHDEKIRLEFILHINGVGQLDNWAQAIDTRGKVVVSDTGLIENWKYIILAKRNCNYGARDHHFTLVSYSISGSFVDTNVATYLFHNPQHRPFCSARSL